jgi:hypothetical protein
MSRRGHNHHRAPGTRQTRVTRDSYLDVEDWVATIERELPHQRWADARGELELMATLLDDAMASIFTAGDYKALWGRRHCAEPQRRAFIRARRVEDLQWLFESTGPYGARECCSTLAYAGWTKTRRGWPVNHEKLCEGARRGLAMGLSLYGGMYGPQVGRPMSAETRAKLSVTSLAARARERMARGITGLGAGVENARV